MERGEGSSLIYITLPQCPCFLNPEDLTYSDPTFMFPLTPRHHKKSLIFSFPFAGGRTEEAGVKVMEPIDKRKGEVLSCLRVYRRT